MITKFKDVLIYEHIDRYLAYMEKVFLRDFEHNPLVEDILKNLGTPFIKADLSKLIQDDDLFKFQDEIIYWIENSSITPERLILRIGNQFFNNITDKSNVELFSLIAPRAMQLQAGEGDGLITPSDRDAMKDVVSTAYRLLNAEKKFDYVHHNGGHILDWAHAEPFLGKHLK